MLIMKKITLYMLVALMALAVPLLILALMTVVGSFLINGVGGLYLNSITFQDYDFFMLLSGFYTLVSLTAGIVIDISYGFIDPRIRMGAK